MPKSYQTALALACRMASANMIAKYDAGNPDAPPPGGQGRAAEGVSRPVLQACREASQKVFQEMGAKDPMFKKLYDSMTAFRDKEIPWFRVAEGGFDGLMAAPASRKPERFRPACGSGDILFADMPLCARRSHCPHMEAFAAAARSGPTAHADQGSVVFRRARRQPGTPCVHASRFAA